ncbi:hypothetical protein MBM_02213 [Drepanopeziza brunnea f. sp. 'multigermtubi' MB_m1]|uniref:Uncharacterized protein n=1 Tax=Marssonina brunnea f. sp. multigermtubi (strain MB_m1) TaxID=1072389 RepID=K1X511_MARBU|nr:uncharacterized protein MBM_02213 [Drepanopeziza brunnea f. sp. 'multigermtubi' MB_m1]EKD20261.1 hypothetical protein MBM_02213 [Drepanopeziza brunnea f. sp. 'multigermtubi' MB_m1]
MNTGLKTYTTLPLLALPALPPSLALVIVDLAILYAFITTRMLLPSAPRAPCFNSANITDFIENKIEQGRLFFLGLLVEIRNKTIKHCKVDELDLDSYAAFDDFVVFAFKTDQSAKTIEAINREKSFLANFIKDIRTLVKEYTELASVLNFKFDSKTTTKPLLSIPLKMLEVRSASKVEFRLLLSATNYKDEKEEEVKDTGAICKIIAFARIPKTQLKLFINTGINVRPLRT